jgi:hypothetical protein
MSKYNYFSVHELLDLAMIYDDCGDYTPVFWNPDKQQQYFCKSVEHIVDRLLQNTGKAIVDTGKLPQRALTIHLTENKTEAITAGELFESTKLLLKDETIEDSFRVQDNLGNRICFTGSSNPDKMIYFSVWES